MGKVLKALIAFKADTKDADKAEKALLNLEKRYDAVKAAALSVANTIARITDQTDTLVTSQKLLASTFGDTTKDLTAYINSMSQMSGLSESALSKQASMFGNISHSLGLVNGEATTLTKGLTDLSTRLSMLYNYDFAQTSKTMVDVMKGASETFTTLTGKVVNENTVQNYLTSMGIDRTVASLNTAELAVARYLSIANQLNATNKEMEATTNGVAWQKMMLRQQIIRLTEAFGKLLYPILQKILPILNAILIVVTNIINIFAKLIGYNGEITSSVGSASSGYLDLSNNIDKASDSAKKSLRNFDKLNNIQTPSDKNSSNGLSIDPALGGLLNDMNNQLLDIENKAQEIANSIMEWLGFTIDENGEITDFNITLGTVLGTIGGIALAIGALKKTFGTISWLASLFGYGSKSVAKGASNADKSIKNLLPAIAKFAATPLGGILIGIAAALTVGSVAINAYYKDVETADEKLNKLENTSKETKEALEPLRNGFKNLKDTISDISYDNVELTKDEKEKIVNSIDSLTEEMETTLNSYMERQKADLKRLYKDEKLISEQEYKDKLKELDKYEKNELSKIKQHNLDLKANYQSAFDEQGNIQAEGYGNFLKALDTYETEYLTKWALSEEDKNEIQATAQLKSRDERLKYYSDLLTDYANLRDTEKANAKAKYEQTVIDAARLYGVESDTYKRIKNDAYNTYQEEVKNAEDKYNDMYNEFVSYNKDVKKYIDKDTGGLMGSWKRWWNSFKETARPVVETITGWMKKLFGSNYGTKSTISIDGSTKMYAEGGFPEDGLFFANHNELVGKFSNGKTAVANNDQITKGIEEASFQGMMKALKYSNGMGTTNVNITAEGDTSGLLDFITFKQQQKDRRNGF